MSVCLSGWLAGWLSLFFSHTLHLSFLVFLSLLSHLPLSCQAKGSAAKLTRRDLDRGQSSPDQAAAAQAPAAASDDVGLPQEDILFSTDNNDGPF